MLNPVHLHEVGKFTRGNCGPVSDTTCLGSPLAAKTFLSVAVVLAVMVVISTILGLLEWASTSTRNMLPMKGQKKKNDVYSFPWFFGSQPGVEWCRWRGTLDGLTGLTASSTLVQPRPPHVASCNCFHSCDSRMITM